MPNSTEETSGPGRGKGGGGRRATSWKPGQSGNPRGMPKGTRPHALRLLDAIGDESARGIIEAMVAKALKGDTVAAEVVLKHAWPVRKGTPVVIEGMPRIETPADVHAALAVIAGSMAEGGLTPEEATSAARVIEVQRRSLESIALEKRIEALEQGIGGGLNHHSAEGNPQSRPTRRAKSREILSCADRSRWSCEVTNG